MKKGDLSINIIIIAAIALIILVIIAVLLFRSGNSIVIGTSCLGIGGTCIASGESCSDRDATFGGSWIRHPTASCPQDNQCCVKQ